MNYRTYGLVILSLLSTSAVAAEERSEMKFDALPEAVRNTVSHFIDQKNITQIEQVTDDGYVKFEIKSSKTVENKEFVDTDMTVAADGEIMSIAKLAPEFAIPFPVMKQVVQRYPGLKVDEVEIVQTRYFLLTGKANGQSVNLKIYDDGVIQEIPSAQNQHLQPKPIKQIQDKPPAPSDDGYERVMPDEEDELPIDPSDYNFNPNSDEQNQSMNKNR